MRRLDLRAPGTFRAGPTPMEEYVNELAAELEKLEARIAELESKAKAQP